MGGHLKFRLILFDFKKEVIVPFLRVSDLRATNPTHPPHPKQTSKQNFKTSIFISIIERFSNYTIGDLNPPSPHPKASGQGL